MSVFEPQVITNILSNSSLVPKKDQKTFPATFNALVKKRADGWSKLPESRRSSRPRSQLEWEAQVVEYVTFIWEKTRPQKKTNSAAKLSADVPLLGPRFVPPSYVHLQKRAGILDVGPEVQYLKPVNVIHPLYYPELACCPKCQSTTGVNWEGWTGTGARDVHGIFEDEVAVGSQLRCSVCKENLKKPDGDSDEVLTERVENEKQLVSSSSYCCATTSHIYWKSWPHWKIPGGIPIFLHRCALTRDLFDLIIELRPSTTSGGLAEQIKQLHLLEYHRRKLEYLNRIEKVLAEPRTVASYFGVGRKGLQVFSAFDDPMGYNAQCISADIITETYLDFSTRARERESQSYMRSLTVICGSFDSAFKVSNKATISDKECQRARHLKGGILSVINEQNEIVAWRFCQSKANAEIEELLTGLKRRSQLLGQPLPEMFVSDNCCMVRSAITAVFPESDSIQDVWHFITRYMSTILNGIRNPHHAAIMSDITKSILERHASEGNDGAKYWPKEEQEKRLVATYNKWAERGTVWSAASEKVHQEQLKHVRRGCLQRRRQDVLSDGSRIEGLHKAWNTLQRAQPSGIVMLAALSHDFVHRRNIRIASQVVEKTKTPFITLTASSHHTELIDATAKLHNRLRAADSGCTLLDLPQLQSVDSDETFGLVPSAHISTFGGLVKEEPDESQVDVFSSSINSHDSAYSSSIIEPMILSSHEFIFDELKIDPKLLELPQIKASSESSAVTGGKRKAETLSDKSTESGVPADALVRRINTVSNSGPESHCSPTLKEYFKQQGPRPPKSRKVDTTDTNTAVQSNLTPSMSSLPESSTDLPIAPSSKATLALSERPTHGKETRSERLFLFATGIHPDSLKISGNQQFYLFMEMRAEFGWISYEMTSRKWVEAAEEYNRRLVQRSEDTAVVKKHPLALLRKLGEIEPRLIERVLTNNFASKQHNGDTAFWRRHCTVINLVKNCGTADMKRRKVPVCNRCKTIMYPGPTKSATNHRKGVCADGVKSKPTADSPELPHWPQPHGIFSDGTTFHPQGFLKMVQEIYEIAVSGSALTVLVVEAQAFLQMLTARTLILSDTDGHPSTALFKLYPGFKLDSSASSDRVVQHEGADYLRVSYLEQDA